MTPPKKSNYQHNADYLTDWEKYERKRQEDLNDWMKPHQIFSDPVAPNASVDTSSGIDSSTNDSSGTVGCGVIILGLIVASILGRLGKIPANVEKVIDTHLPQQERVASDLDQSKSPLYILECESIDQRIANFGDSSRAYQEINSMYQQQQPEAPSHIDVTSAEHKKFAILWCQIADQWLTENSQKNISQIASEEESDGIQNNSLGSPVESPQLRSTPKSFNAPIAESDGIQNNSLGSPVESPQLRSTPKSSNASKEELDGIQNNSLGSPVESPQLRDLPKSFKVSEDINPCDFTLNCQDNVIPPEVDIPRACDGVHQYLTSLNLSDEDYAEIDSMYKGGYVTSLKPSELTVEHPRYSEAWCLSAKSWVFMTYGALM